MKGAFFDFSRMMACVGMLATAAGAAEPGIPPSAPSATALIENCRAMLPASVELKGRIILRNRKGIPQAEYGYVLVRKQGQTNLQLADDEGKPVSFAKEGRILGTDVTWSDLTLDYLWWGDASFDEMREGETVHGQVCSIVVLKKGERLVRVWIDRKTGALMQAEEFCGEKPVRRLWGTRLKKFGDRWMANVLEVETLGTGHRTKITVEELK